MFYTLNTMAVTHHYYVLAVFVLLFMPVSGNTLSGHKADCFVRPDPSSSQEVTGVVRFSQTSENDPITITVQLSGLDPVSAESDDSKFMHGFHVHEYGDISGGCTGTGGHFNPFNAEHGAPTATNRHVGDFGNIRQDATGTISTTFTDNRASLFGKHAIVGRAIVLHAGKDDLGLGGNAASLANGNAGSRLGCCVIGWAKN